MNVSIWIFTENAKTHGRTASGERTELSCTLFHVQRLLSSGALQCFIRKKTVKYHILRELCVFAVEIYTFRCKESSFIGWSYSRRSYKLHEIFEISKNSFDLNSRKYFEFEISTIFKIKFSQLENSSYDCSSPTQPAASKNSNFSSRERHNLDIPSDWEYLFVRENFHMKGMWNPADERDAVQWSPVNSARCFHSLVSQNRPTRLSARSEKESNKILD